MTTRYQKRHYEDVARLLNKQPVASVGSLYHAVKRMGEDFADLFAADNPPTCSVCGTSSLGGQSLLCAVGFGSTESTKEHDWKDGFDRARFLAACGLEPKDVDTWNDWEPPMVIGLGTNRITVRRPLPKGGATTGT